jgi:hypothetical protein
MHTYKIEFLCELVCLNGGMTICMSWLIDSIQGPYSKFGLDNLISFLVSREYLEKRTSYLKGKKGHWD